MDQLVDERGARGARREDPRRGAGSCATRAVEPDDAPPTDDDCVRSAARTDNPIPTPPFWGVREIDVDLDELYPYLDRHVLFKLHWGGRGVKGEAWTRAACSERLRAAPRAHVARAGLPAPARAARLLPVLRRGQRARRPRPRGPRDASSSGFVFPRQPKHDRICLADFYRPKDSGERDVVALQAVTVGSEVTELMARLEAEGEFAEQLFVHGLGVQTAEGLAEWLHAKVRARPRDRRRDQGRRYSWGYPACPDQSEHEKV